MTEKMLETEETWPAEMGKSLLIFVEIMSGVEEREERERNKMWRTAKEKNGNDEKKCNLKKKGVKIIQSLEENEKI